MRPSRAARWAAEAARLAPCPATAVSLGVLTDEASLPNAVALADGIGRAFVETVVLLDASAGPDVPLPPRTRLHVRRLAGHFGAQRTALQRLARTPWLLQLDTDETMGPDALACLPGFLRAADRDGFAALGLPRRNLVGGVLSDHYPDPQYRLCRRTVAYEGRVHERPRLLSRARQSRPALGLHIEHALAADRVRARTARYGAMSDGATDTARRRDERALLTPFAP